MAKYVTEQTRPDLDWNPKPRGIYLPFELINSDAFRSLSKTETDILLFIYTRRIYPGRQRIRKRKSMDKIDQWNPINGREMKAPYVAITEFFNPVKSDRQPRMRITPPSESTIVRAIKKLMQVGFIDLVNAGGNGKGDCNVYRVTHNWRVWREGDKPCFSKAGMSREKGFCKPGSGAFNPTKNEPKN